MSLLSALPAARGHYLLESGYHSDLWLTLDGVFVDPAAIAPAIGALAAKLATHRPTAVCGSLLGGAFLAQRLAEVMRVRFFFSEPAPATVRAGLFAADYRLPSELVRRIRGERVAVVDDVISAGSSARATVRAVTQAEAQPIVVGALMTLGRAGLDYFAAAGVPVETIERRDFNVWPPDACPLCRAGRVLEDPPR